ncbi:LysE family translocator [Photorhabdus temperata]|uniref:LysE family translocator n=1 Tax=Photorhabdus temperata TaxID=574560 RepID=UPI0021D4EE3A|nr:LysE family translocator [Photorhabdus temperata]MCT8348617.1 LysE family translocator [Photorhabdus temperata]
MSPSVLATFWAVSFLFVITPGMDWAYAISAGIRGRMVMPAVSGMLLGHLAATGLVAAGVGALVANMPLALTMLTIVGAGYLLWLGVGLIRNPAVPTTELTDTPDNAMRWILKGVGVSGLNPKVFLLFLALLPQFSDPKSSWPLPTQILTLGSIHIVSCGVVYLLVGYGSRVVLKTRPAAAKLVSRISGAAMIGIALVLLAETVI